MAEPHFEFYELPELPAGLEAILQLAEERARPSKTPVCDFCAAPDPTWIYAADPMASMAFGPDGKPQNLFDSDTPWAACDGCSERIERRDLAAMAQHARESSEGYALMLRIGGRQFAEEATIVPSLALWRTFLKSRNGPRRRA